MDLVAVAGHSLLSEGCVHVVYMCMLGSQAGHSVLIFCGTKRWCEDTARQIAKHITVPERAMPGAAAGGGAGDDEDDPSGHVPRAQLLTELTRAVAKPDEVLKEVLPAGVAFHHSGLTGDEKLLVERAFCSGEGTVPGL